MNSVLIFITRPTINFFPILEKCLIFFYIIIYCVGAVISNLMSISDDLVSYIFRRKMEKT